ncbi:pyridoxamine 5'-phosphate oxidase family protein [Pseudonocardia aurantiaca]|uniref:Pyridoxamine 5'-phosphate oxidase family protein n=1 Tax=Pseudonocardia aurantiaca TaxID=75290 RepID=A0ABW4FT50_9PSEU
MRPLLASSGQVPDSAANAASLRHRPGWEKLTTIWAAVTGPPRRARGRTVGARPRRAPQRSRLLPCRTRSATWELVAGELDDPLEPDGKPHSTVVRVKRDGDDILFALPKSRRKTANLNRDPRAAVAIFDAANPYENVQVQGTASIEDDPDGMLSMSCRTSTRAGRTPGSPGRTRNG